MYRPWCGWSLGVKRGDVFQRLRLVATHSVVSRLVLCGAEDVKALVLSDRPDIAWSSVVGGYPLTLAHPQWAMVGTRGEVCGFVENLSSGYGRFRSGVFDGDAHTVNILPSLRWLSSKGESLLLYHVKTMLLRMGYDVIKKRMWKDGHLVDDSRQYVRTRGDVPYGFYVTYGQYGGGELSGCVMMWYPGRGYRSITGEGRRR